MGANLSKIEVVLEKYPVPGLGTPDEIAPIR
jgi:hypothetical protein